MRVCRVLLHLTIFSVILGQFGRLPLGSENFNFYLQDVLVFVFVGVTLLFFVAGGGYRNWRLTARDLAGASFLAWAGLTFVFHHPWLTLEQNALGFSYWLRLAVYLLYGFCLRELIRCDEDRLRPAVLRSLGLAGWLLAVFGFVQLAILPDLAVLAETAGYDPHRQRLVSTFLDPNFTGAFLVLTLNLLFSLPTNFWRRRLVAVFFLLTALILTFSRSAWLMLAVSVFLFGVFKSRKLLFAAVLIGFLAYFLVPRVQTRLAGVTDPDDSAKLRLVSWQKTGTIARDHLWLGVGFNNFRAAQEDYGFFDYNLPEGGRAGAGSDSSLLLVLATTGVIGFLLYVFFLLTLAGEGWVGVRSGDPLAFGLLVSLGGLLLESNFINSLFFTPVLLWLFSLTAILKKSGRR